MKAGKIVRSAGFLFRKTAAIKLQALFLTGILLLPAPEPVGGTRKVVGLKPFLIKGFDCLLLLWKQEDAGRFCLPRQPALAKFDSAGWHLLL